MTGGQGIVYRTCGTCMCMSIIYDYIPKYVYVYIYIYIYIYIYALSDTGGIPIGCRFNIGLMLGSIEVLWGYIAQTVEVCPLAPLFFFSVFQRVLSSKLSGLYYQTTLMLIGFQPNAKIMIIYIYKHICILVYLYLYFICLFVYNSFLFEHMLFMYINTYIYIYKHILIHICVYICIYN